MQAFHNDPSIKELYVYRVRAHALADEIIQGTYWENGRGCAVGCTIHGSLHSRYEDELGIPRQLAYLQDRIFEELPLAEAKNFPLAFLTAIPVGADLSLILPRFFVWLLSDPTWGTWQWCTDQGKEATLAVKNLYQQLLDGKEVSRKEWQDARKLASAAAAAASSAASAAYDAAAAAAAYAVAAAYDAASAAAAAASYAAYDAASGAAAAAAASAAYDAAYAAASAAAAAASYAAASAVAVAARKKQYCAMRDELLRLLQAA